VLSLHILYVLSPSSKPCTPPSGCQAYCVTRNDKSFGLSTNVSPENDENVVQRSSRHCVKELWYETME